MRIIKRNGSEAEFDVQRIIDAIEAANGDVTADKRLVHEDVAAAAASVRARCEACGHTPSVEEIQDWVETEIMMRGRYDLAREYIIYRYKQWFKRKSNTTDDKILSLIDSTNEEVKQENSNKNPTVVSVQRDYMAGEVSRDLVRRILVPEEIMEAHDEGVIHFHDADYFSQRMHNCDVYNLEDMLQNGTVISGTLIEKPHSFSTACNIATQIMAQVASCQYGGQSISLAHLAPFVDVSRRKIRDEVLSELDEAGLEHDAEQVEKMVALRLADEIKRGVQTIQYQVMTLMTTNGQAPFITVFMCLDEAKDEREREDLAMVIEEVLRQRHRGVKNEQGVWITPAFPKLVYALGEDNVDEGSKYHYLTKLAAKCTARRMVPDYVSVKVLRDAKLPASSIMHVRERRDAWGDESTWGPNPFAGLTDEECGLLELYAESVMEKWDPSYNKTGGPIAESDVEAAKALMAERGVGRDDLVPQVWGPMGCRSFLTPDYVHYKVYGRFNQGVVTINLPDVALSSKGDRDAFWRIFEDRLELCHRALRVRHERLLGTLSDAAPILWQHGALSRLASGERIDKLLYGGYSTLSLGYAGLYECVRYMTGKSHTDEEATPFALSVMQKMNDKCAEWREAEDIHYSLYGTPIESTTYRFAKALQRRFGVVEGITDKGYITNSYHVHVTEEIDAFEKLKFESQFQRLSPGGAISYVEVPDMQDNIPAVLSVMRYIYDNIVYAELNTKSDYCQECGYDGEIVITEDDGKLVWECPSCGNRDQDKMNVARRTCGYIGTQFWNQGRTEEIRDRVMHL